MKPLEIVTLVRDLLWIGTGGIWIYSGIKLLIRERRASRDHALFMERLKHLDEHYREVRQRLEPPLPPH